MSRRGPPGTATRSSGAASSRPGDNGVLLAGLRLDTERDRVESPDEGRFHGLAGFHFAAATGLLRSGTTITAFTPP